MDSDVFVCQTGPMNGPFWNDKTGVTGEPNFRTQKPSYETSVVDGKTVTRIVPREEDSVA